ncbi:MAG: 50S ribosomal protein L20 [Dehalococcoidia bacterium]|nr:50S ribosomal protein L20 [Dehalococcoidia bacterium]
MARIKMGVTKRRRHNKVLEITKGQRATRHTLYKRAHEAMLHSLNYAYIHRRERKGDMRRIWITRINAACRANGLSYSQFMAALKNGESALNRKTLADIAVRNPGAFAEIVSAVKPS